MPIASFPSFPSFSAALTTLTATFVLTLTQPLSAQPLPPELFLPPFPELGQTTSASVAASAAARPVGEASPGLLGRWVTASGNLEVEIAPCAQAQPQQQPQPLCGTVTRVLGNRSMARDGEMQPVDNRPAVGMQILRGLTLAHGDDPQASGAPWFGEIYNRENGRTYRCRVHLGTAQGAGNDLVVRPYVFTPLFGQTQHWQRASAELAQQAHPKETP